MSFQTTTTWLDAYNYAVPMFNKHGAADSEPMSHLREILNACFGEEC